MNVIFNIRPRLTPFTSRVGRVPCRNVTHSWQTDTLAVAADTAQLDGDSFLGDSLAATSRPVNTTQITKRQVEVSESAIASDTAGRANEYAYQLMVKAAQAVKRDVEKVLTGNGIPVIEGSANSTTARHLRPLCSWYTTNVVNTQSGGANGSATTARTDAGSPIALTETTLRSLLQAIWSSGGFPDTLLCGPFNKGLISQFPGPRGRQRINIAKDGVLSARIDVYGSDFGELDVVPSHFSRERDLHALQTDLWAIAWYRDYKIEDLAKTGDARKGQVVCEYTLQAGNEAGSGLVADLTAA